MSESMIEPCPVVVLQETPKAYFLKDGNEHGPDDWFPKSQVSFKRRSMLTGEAIAEIPEWLLKKKGWVE